MLIPNGVNNFTRVISIRSLLTLSSIFFLSVFDPSSVHANDNTDAISLEASVVQNAYLALGSAVYKRVAQLDAREVTPAFQKSAPPITYLQIGSNSTSPDHAVHSESTGYKMLIDLSNSDKAAVLQDIGFMACYLDSFGLMNWNVDPQTGRLVSGYGGHYAAADADLDIVFTMIQAIQKWPDILKAPIQTTTIGYNQSGELPPVYGETSVLELIKSQLSAIWTREIGHSQALGINNLLLNGDSWRRDAQGNYIPSQGIDISYFRPSYCQTFQAFYNQYMKTDPRYSLQNQTWYSPDPCADCVYNANYNFIFESMKNNTLCLPPDSVLPEGSKKYQPGGALLSNGYDAVRVVMMIARDYVKNPYSSQAIKAKQILQTIVGYYVEQTKTGARFTIPSPSIAQAMTETTAPAYAQVLFDPAATPLIPSPSLQYRDKNGRLIYNPGHPTVAGCLLIAAHALGSSYASLESTCYDYLMSNLPADVGGGGGSDGSVRNISYYAGMLTAISSEFLGGNLPR